MLAQTVTTLHPRKRYIRPLVVSVAMTEIGEALLLIGYGLILFPGGNLLSKVVWTLLFCGIGMGASLGAAISVFVVDKFDGIKGVIVTTALSFAMLGIACDLLCLNLDRQFHFFGGTSNPNLFIWGSIVGSIVGGLTVGILIFTRKGNELLEMWRV